MPSVTDVRPAEDEYPPYCRGYVALLPEGDIVEVLEAQGEETLALVRGITGERAGFRYAPGKWSVREVLGHLSDTERIMANRALRIARGDRTPLPGYDENAYVADAGFDARTLRDLAAELSVVRRATLLLFGGLPEEAWLRRGVANGSEVSVRALACIIAGHEAHHREILRERYLA